MRYMLTDDLWQALEPAVQQSKWYKGGQKPTLSDRQFFEALLYWFIAARLLGKAASA